MCVYIKAFDYIKERTWGFREYGMDHMVTETTTSGLPQVTM